MPTTIPWIPELAWDAPTEDQGGKEVPNVVKNDEEIAKFTVGGVCAAMGAIFGLSEAAC